MKIYKTLLIGILIVASFAIGVSAQYYNQRFVDVVPGHWASLAIDFVSERGLMTGRTQHEFAPEQFVNRAELAVIIERMYRSGRTNFTQNDGYLPAYRNNYYTGNQYSGPYSTNLYNRSLDEQRRRDVRQIANAISRYSLNNAGKFPKSIKTGDFIEICYSSAGESCKNKIDLGNLQTTYLSSIPRDPSIIRNQQETNAMPDATTGYFSKLDDDGRVHILAKLATVEIEEVVQSQN